MAKQYVIRSEVPAMYVVKDNNYGCMLFLLDLFMIVFTGGLWIIWIVIREMRR